MTEPSEVIRGATSVRAGMVSTYPPTRCGIARFASSLVENIPAVDPTIDIDVVRLLTDTTHELTDRSVVLEIDPTTSVGVRAAGRHLSECDVALIQHEFGLYGPNDGESVIGLLEAIDTQRIVVLHTVLPHPTDRQRELTRRMQQEATLVVLCESAATLLEERYSIPRESVSIVHHGASWSARQMNPPPRNQLITWGLLGPGKGIERALTALAQLRDADPPIRYRIVGRTHPVVAARSGMSYRSMLEDLVGDLELSDVVEFIDRYVDDAELHDLVRTSDVVVVPYDNHDQVSSGVITEAIGIGRPVVATRFPYSEEVLQGGAGLVVDHEPDAMAAAIRLLLSDANRYRRAAETAAAMSDELSWSRVANHYARLIKALVPSAATA